MAKCKSSIGLSAVLAVVAFLGAGQAHADSDAVDFATCVAALGAHARDRGISPALVDESLAAVTFSTRVIELDREQPEFVTSFGEYYRARVTESRVERGREMLARHEPLLQEIYREYGVPPRYLVALWGMETNYGSYFGHSPVLDSLVTLACDGRRGEMFTEQLVAALGLIQEESVSADRLAGSWAGAMGHMQFMPTVYREYAIDFDGSGRADLWDSLPDAMASAANYLRGIGWESGWRWGREVSLPDEFPYELAGRDQSRPLAEWHELGVRDSWGNALDQSDPAAEAALLVPSGHAGPAFLVYANFETIMKWNWSEHYALAVGRLADRIIGGGELRQPPPETAPLSRERIAALQERLNEKGYDAGPVDGIPGPMTRRAIRDFQKSRGMIADGYPSEEVLDELSLKIAELD